MKDENIKMSHKEWLNMRLYYKGEDNKFYKVKSILAKQHKEKLKQD